MNIFKFAHSPGISKYLITLRNCFRQKSFPACEKNLFFISKSFKDNQKYEYYELGVGYTITDFLIIKQFIKINKATITDLNELFCPRIYALCTMLNPYNYTTKYFWNSFNFLFAMLLKGKFALKCNNLSYQIIDATSINYPKNCLIFSNAVLEHIKPCQINTFLKSVAISCPKAFFGIVDCNDHINRDLPIELHFKNYSCTNYEIQTRGNNISKSEWLDFFKMNFTEFKMSEHFIDQSKIENIYYYFCS